MGGLVMMSRLMNISSRNVRLEDVEVAALRGALEKCLDVLMEIPAEAEQHGGHLRYLLQRCLDILDGDRVDLIALQNLSFQVVGEALGDVRLWKWDESGTFFQNIAVIARVWGPKMATSAAKDYMVGLAVDGTKVAGQLGVTVVKGLLEAPQDD